MVKNLDQFTLGITKVIRVVLIEGSFDCVESNIQYHDCVWLYKSMILPKDRSLCFKFT